MIQEASVLVISDRPEQAAPLVRAIGTVVTCRQIASGSEMPAQRPFLAVVDVTEDEAAATTWLTRLHGLRVPSLQLAPRPVTTRPPTRFLPANAPRMTVLAAVFDLMDGIEAGRERRFDEADRRRIQVGTKAETANHSVTEAFDAARRGAPLSLAAVEAGTEAILEAVSEYGIRTWLEIIGRYDQQLYQHSLSVAGYAAAFGAGLSLARADQMNLARAALLHDIGKSRIPLAILNKPDRLTADEMAVMRTHPSVGADLLEDQGTFDPTLLAVVRHHHEMLDGSGYPDGLSGTEIPDLVRLVTICDIHSALTERRAYRNPLPHEAAHEIMRDMGEKLDTDLLRAYRSAVVLPLTQTPVA
ncbi:HD-GYP domain-containing protein [Methylobacterium gossipiicola]|uniref:HDIG domain-containing protein n=1 Tax=Methylobacterium gossipiicola TaxID=582675 RepID=A0A1I2S0Z2_9HYPH|nr:HD domain-containing phosphohydrolase [Methylobacterium gossipiicola]SFG43671.1 HDIG domain-containing protein [Methylobacterium gossipiicola]